jgi:hypothetical protein
VAAAVVASIVIYKLEFNDWTLHLNAGDAIEMSSGITAKMPIGTSAIMRRLSSREPGGISDWVEITNWPRKDASVYLFSFRDPSKSSALRGVMKSYRWAGGGSNNTEVRWHDYEGDIAALAIVTRVPGADTGMIQVFGVRRIGNRETALKEARALCNNLGVRGVDWTSL